ncbi:MAG TPA: hypothetical protein VME23_10290 [Terracidiphilus sp.]|nr:hypothetical protein [Terracidiphilus sp.]
MKEILIAGLVVLTLIGIRIAHSLEKIWSVLGEIRGNLPDKHFQDERAFWEQLQFSMNRISRIYDKFVLGKDYLAESQETRERMPNQIEATGSDEGEEETQRPDG